MSIHPRQTFIRCTYTPSYKDAHTKHHRPLVQQGLTWFFGGIVNTPTERKLAALMNGRKEAA